MFLRVNFLLVLNKHLFIVIAIINTKYLFKVFCFQLMGDMEILIPLGSTLFTIVQSHHRGLDRWTDDAMLRWRWRDDTMTRWCKSAMAMVRIAMAMMRWRWCNGSMMIKRHRYCKIGLWTILHMRCLQEKSDKVTL